LSKSGALASTNKAAWEQIVNKNLESGFVNPFQSAYSRLGPLVLAKRFLFAVCILCLTGTASAQGILVGTPFHTNSDSFYERNGVNFGFGFPNGRPGFGSRIVGLLPNGAFNPNGIQFNQGSFGSTLPQFGGYDPNASARTGFGRVGGNGPNFSLGFEFGKGSTRNATSQAPSVVIPNGGIGSVTSGQNSPFVTSVTPVVFGNGLALPPSGNSIAPIMPGSYRIPSGSNYSALRQQLNLGANSDGFQRPDYSIEIKPEESSAQFGDISVKEIKRQRELAKTTARVEQQEKIDAYMANAKKFEANGQLVKALLNIYKAKRIAPEQLAKTLQAEYDRIKQLEKTKKR